MAVMIQARHLFYGLSMLDKFKGLGWKKYYLIFGMCDETFSVNYTSEIPEDVDRGWFYFFVTENALGFALINACLDDIHVIKPCYSFYNFSLHILRYLS